MALQSVARECSLEGFPVCTVVDVRWRDVDAFGHVNNAVYFTYLEIARTHYFEHVFHAYELDEIDFIVVSAHCDYYRQVSRGDSLVVGISITRAGRTSFDFAYELRSLADNALVAKGLTTQVRFDYAKNAKKVITRDWLEKVEAAEGRMPEREQGPA